MVNPMQTQTEFERRQKKLLQGSTSLSEAVNAYERALITQALALAKGKISHAAVLLGISYQALAWILDGRQKGLRVEKKVKRKAARSLETAL